ncbi:Zn-dependent hydrolase [Rhodopila sp.]|uniref:Zn-dependent hydrolase n=1 Tax=Rhodopila sp. TaxID=2480087 RepID=UPI003D0DD747
MTAPTIRPVRFLGMFNEIARLGATEAGGVHRLAASAEDAAARDRLTGWFTALGMRTLIDPIGNMAGMLELAGPNAPVVMAGSHLDSQPQGGRFDGALGVVAACEAASVLRDAAAAGKLSARCNLAVTNWTSEEGARFQPSLLGSSVFVGGMAQAEALERIDRDGMALGEALRAIGYSGQATLPHPAAYVELHIECGPLLEKAGDRLGVFTRYWGAVKHRLAFIGEQAHTGPTPMAERRDALLGAAYLIASLREMSEQAPGVLHTSTGRIDVSPNSPNVVPAEAVLFVELRSVEPDVLAWAEAQLRQRATAAAAKACVTLDWRAVAHRPAGRFHQGVIAICEEAARSVGVPARRLATVPGHDAISLSSICPAAMLVVPSLGGVCHSAAEFTADDDIVLGTEMLTRVLWCLCRYGVPE